MFLNNVGVLVVFFKSVPAFWNGNNANECKIMLPRVNFLLHYKCTATMHRFSYRVCVCGAAKKFFWENVISRFALLTVRKISFPRSSRPLLFLRGMQSLDNYPRSDSMPSLDHRVESFPERQRKKRILFFSFLLQIKCPPVTLIQFRERNERKRWLIYYENSF